MDVISYLFLPLLLTLIIEVGALFLLKERRGKVYFAAILMNIFTNISLNLFNYYVIIEELWVAWLVLIFLEFFIWFLEGLGYFILLKDIKRAICYTLVLNMSSFFFGSSLLWLIQLLWR